MSLHVRAQICRDALQHNLSIVKQHCPRQKIWAMVKADAYGHGMERTAKALSGVDAYGVATLREAFQLRRVIGTTPIVVMRGFVTTDDVLQMQSKQITPVIHHLDQLDCLEKTALNTPIPAWIKIDTGMNRLGFKPNQLAMLHQRLVQLPLDVQGWMTHFAQADRVDDEMTARQLAAFEVATSELSCPLSLANSAAILAHPKTHADWVRPGLMLYGVSPFADSVGSDFGLKPVMTLEAPIISIKQLGAGEGIGYGGSWHAPETMSCAIVGIGYGDGYPREVSSAQVSIDGVLCPIVGNVSMDMLAVDLRPLQGRAVTLGQWVCLWGPDNPVERVASAAGTIPYTLLTRLAGRVCFQQELTL